MPHYDRHANASAEQNTLHDASPNALDEEAMEDAAESLRQTEVDAVQEAPDISSINSAQLDSMSIDELRAIANTLDIPDRGKITEQDELVAAIRQRL
jgi:hypothetical protein